MSDQTNALKRFKEAWYNLSFYWDRNNSNLDNTEATRKLYPFHKCFDELDIPRWVDATIKELRPTSGFEREEIKIDEVRSLMKILRQNRDYIDCVSVHTVDELYRSLKCLEYNKNIIEFYKMLVDAMPDLPNDTPEQQEAFDDAWEKFYMTDFTISFGDKSVTISNEATVYNGIVDTLKELIDYCL